MPWFVNLSHFKTIRTKMTDNADSQKALQIIPGVGKSISRDLVDLDYKCVEELRGEDPQLMYEKLCRLRGEKIDRCVLYVFRCAVYFASTNLHDPELLKWWHWKNRA